MKIPGQIVVVPVRPSTAGVTVGLAKVLEGRRWLPLDNVFHGGTKCVKLGRHSY